MPDHDKAAGPILDRLMLGKVHIALAGLPPGHRRVLALIAIEGLSYRKAAKVIDLPSAHLADQVSSS